MQKSIISWTQQTWNAVSGCSKVSDGCKFCYAAAMSKRYGWTTKEWTLQNEDENIVMKPHKLKEPYLLKEPTRVFVNSMSDQFHRTIPDWYRAAIFCVMLDLPQHTFQILTKRADATVDWHERFKLAVYSAEFIKFTADVKDKRVKAALEKGRSHMSPWADHIWMGTSVEDSRVLHRIDSLRQCKAHVRFISAEPLIGAWGKDVDLTGIHWIIVGGESGVHMTEGNARWMKQEWAREIRDLCEAQSVAFFYKQDSGVRTEMRPFLIEADGSKWDYKQYPGNLAAAINWDTKTPREPAKPLYNGYTKPLPDSDWGHSEVFEMTNWDDMFKQFEKAEPTPPPEPEPTKPTKLVNFQDVKEHWNPKTQSWDSDEYVYIGRYNQAYNLPRSAWANTFPITLDTPTNRTEAVTSYRKTLKELFYEKPMTKNSLEDLRGKTLVCWCSPKACHGDVIMEMLGEKPAAPKQSETEPKQMTLFDMPQPVNQHRYD